MKPARIPRADIHHVHGTVSDYRAWRPQMDAFGRRFRAITCSRRYQYPNAPPPGAPYSAALHAEDLAAFHDVLNLDRIHLVGGSFGASFGAYAALVFARCHQARVRSLVLAEPPILPLLNEADGVPAILDPGELLHTHFREGRKQDGVRAFIDGAMGSGAFESYSPVARRRLMENAEELRAEPGGVQSDCAGVPDGCPPGRSLNCRIEPLSFRIPLPHRALRDSSRISRTPARCCRSRRSTRRCRPPLQYSS